MCRQSKQHYRDLISPYEDRDIFINASGQSALRHIVRLIATADCGFSTRFLYARGFPSFLKSKF